MREDAGEAHFCLLIMLELACNLFRMPFASLYMFHEIFYSLCHALLPQIAGFINIENEVKPA